MDLKAQIALLLNDLDVVVLDTTTNRHGDYIVTVESTCVGTECRQCGRSIQQLHSYGRSIRLRHFSLAGHNVYLRLRPKRYQCHTCSSKVVTTQKLNWYRADRPSTRPFEQRSQPSGDS